MDEQQIIQNLTNHRLSVRMREAVLQGQLRNIRREQERYNTSGDNTALNALMNSSGSGLMPADEFFNRQIRQLEEEIRQLGFTGIEVQNPDGSLSHGILDTSHLEA